MKFHGLNNAHVHQTIKIFRVNSVAMDILDLLMDPVYMYLVNAMDFQILVTQGQVHVLIVATIPLEDL